MKNKFYTVYKIINLINGKIYIGVHQTFDLNDGYMGSGKILKKAIKKYGIENFKKEYLEIFNTKEKMFEMESKLVNENFIKSENSYNIKCGGFGGFDYINQLDHIKEKSSKRAKLLSKRNWENEKLAKKMRKNGSYQLKKLHLEGKISYDNFKGKTHTEETKKKIGEANSKHQKGSNNSNYGNCWIFNSNTNENKLVKKTELNKWLNQGWQKGRKIIKKKVIK